MTIRRAAQAARAPWGRTKGQGVGRCRLDATAAPEALGLEPSTYAVRLKERARVGWLPRAYAALLSGRGRCGQQKAHSGVWGPPTQGETALKAEAAESHIHSGA